jgi:hypothetical protein
MSSDNTYVPDLKRWLARLPAPHIMFMDPSVMNTLSLSAATNPALRQHAQYSADISQAFLCSKLSYAEVFSNGYAGHGEKSLFALCKANNISASDYILVRTCHHGIAYKVVGTTGTIGQTAVQFEDEAIGGDAGASAGTLQYSVWGNGLPYKTHKFASVAAAHCVPQHSGGGIQVMPASKQRSSDFNATIPDFLFTHTGDSSPQYDMVSIAVPNPPSGMEKLRWLSEEHKAAVEAMTDGFVKSDERSHLTELAIYSSMHTLGLTPTFPIDSEGVDKDLENVKCITAFTHAFGDARSYIGVSDFATLQETMTHFLNPQSNTQLQGAQPGLSLSGDHPYGDVRHPEQIFPASGLAGAGGQPVSILRQQMSVR